MRPILTLRRRSCSLAISASAFAWSFFCFSKNASLSPPENFTVVLGRRLPAAFSCVDAVFIRGKSVSLSFFLCMLLTESPTIRTHARTHALTHARTHTHAHTRTHAQAEEKRRARGATFVQIVCIVCARTQGEELKDLLFKEVAGLWVVFDNKSTPADMHCGSLPCATAFACSNRPPSCTTSFLTCHCRFHGAYPSLTHTCVCVCMCVIVCLCVYVCESEGTCLNDRSSI